MARRHFYIGFENLNLNNTQRGLLVDELKVLGPSSDPQPARLNHWRIRLDNDAAIFEANFEESNLTVNSVKQWLADIFNVNPATIGDVLQQTTYGPMVTYSRGGADHIRILVFGGAGTSWEESRQACEAYLMANLTEWE